MKARTQHTNAVANNAFTRTNVRLQIPKCATLLKGVCTYRVLCSTAVRAWQGRRNLKEIKN